MMFVCFFSKYMNIGCHSHNFGVSTMQNICHCEKEKCTFYFTFLLFFTFTAVSIHFHHMEKSMVNILKNISMEKRKLYRFGTVKEDIYIFLLVEQSLKCFIYSKVLILGLKCMKIFYEYRRSGHVSLWQRPHASAPFTKYLIFSHLWDKRELSVIMWCCQAWEESRAKAPSADLVQKERGEMWQWQSREKREKEITFSNH